MAEENCTRFGSSTEEERRKLVHDAVPVHTRKATKHWASTFAEFVAAKSLPPVDFSIVPLADLAKLLEAFYVDAKKKTGERYKRNS
ncbi:MAG: hypothetical protein AAF471_09745, partial [Myxococcota bacterium]